MLRACLVACVALSPVLGACGPSIPKHSGYKTKTPWKKPKSLELDDKLEASAKGELDYAKYKRARWYALAIPSDGTLALALEYTPIDEAGEATVAMEVYGPSWQLLSEDEDAPLEAPTPDEGDDDDDEDDEEEDDEGETQKQRSLENLAPGTYYIHLFVTGRMDIAEFKLGASFAPVAAVASSDFPKDVAFVPPLPIVPLEDDAPAAEKKPDRKPPRPPRPPRPDKPDKPDKDPAPSTGSVSASVIAATPNDSGGTNITINVGQVDGVEAGRSGSIVGVKNGGFTLSSCGQKSCKATVKATVDQVKGSKMEVVIK